MLSIHFAVFCMLSFKGGGIACPAACSKIRPGTKVAYMIKKNQLPLCAGLHMMGDGLRDIVNGFGCK